MVPLCYYTINIMYLDAELRYGAAIDIAACLYTQFHVRMSNCKYTEVIIMNSVLAEYLPLGWVPSIWLEIEPKETV